GEGEASWFFSAFHDRTIVSGLVPGMPLRLAAVDALDHPLAMADVTLAPGEWRTLELAVTKAARSLRGRLGNAAGEPVAAALVTLDSRRDGAGSRSMWEDSRRIEVDTDLEGRFVLSGLYDGVVHLGVLKAGYVPLIRRDFVLPPEQTP